MNTMKIIASVALLAGFVSQAAAQQTVVTTTQTQAKPQYVGTATVDLNIRSGPGPEHPVIGSIRANDQAIINGCIEGSQWCQISYKGNTGWAYSQYMTVQVAQSRERVVVSERPAQVPLPTITYEAPAPAATTTVTTTQPLAPPRVSGTIVTRTAPATTVATTGVAQPLDIAPPAEVRTYVTSNPVDPVYLNGEVVVGAGLPESVELRTVPNYEYRYVYVNRQPVLVDPDTRRIVYVYR